MTSTKESPRVFATFKWEAERASGNPVNEKHSHKSEKWSLKTSEKYWIFFTFAPPSFVFQVELFIVAVYKRPFLERALQAAGVKGAILL